MSGILLPKTLLTFLIINGIIIIVTAVSSEINKSEIVRQGAVGPLLNLTKSHDGRVQRNAAGALLNLTHIGQPASYVRTLVCTFLQCTSCLR